MLNMSLVRTALVLSALLLANPATSQTEQNEFSTGSGDTVMFPYAGIKWKDKLNPSYANLGNDQFLLDTKDGLVLWDVPTNIVFQPSLSSEIGDLKLEPLDRDASLEYAQMGSPAVGTLVRLTRADQSTIVLWWDGKLRSFVAALNLDKAIGKPDLLPLDSNHALLCSSSVSKVIRIQQSGGKVSIQWETTDNAAVRTAMKAMGVVGKVEGFGALNENDTERPVFFDTSLCRWEIKNPPEHIKQYLDKRTRKYTPFTKPYFLEDGRTLISEVSYFDGQYWRNMNPPLLWQPKTHSWVAIEHTSGDGGDIHRSGQNEPVMAHSFQSNTVEFLDTKTMHWISSRQRLPDCRSPNIEPLSNGNALVIMRDDFGRVGIVAPLRGDLPSGELALRRNQYDGEVDLHDGSLMLVGDGDQWHPSVRSEIIDAKLGVSRSIASLPIPLVSPYGLKLKDDNVLVFGGLPPTCAPSHYFFRDVISKCQPAQPSFLYDPRENIWKPVPGLGIQFTRGYFWETGNSDRASKWPRNDAIVRNNGDVVWLEGGEQFESESQSLPQTTFFMRWRQTRQDRGSKTVSSLRKARTQSSLIELANGKLAVIGGFAQLERVALEKDCFNCPDEFVSIGPFKPARSTEILDEANTGAETWLAGPLAHFGGGRAMKLGNGRIFKLSLVGAYDSEGYRAEISDAEFTRWEELPPFPLNSVTVRNLNVVGNLIVILMDKKPTVIWDDNIHIWRKLEDWPVGTPISVSPLADGKRILVRYVDSFHIVNLP
jgi:hypothetical protein